MNDRIRNVLGLIHELFDKYKLLYRMIQVEGIHQDKKWIKIVWKEEEKGIIEDGVEM